VQAAVFEGKPRPGDQIAHGKRLTATATPPKANGLIRRGLAQAVPAGVRDRSPPTLAICSKDTPRPRCKSREHSSWKCKTEWVRVVVTKSDGAPRPGRLNSISASALSRASLALGTAYGTVFLTTMPVMIGPASVFSSAKNFCSSFKSALAT
jgi:hypothetical protein